MEHPCSKCGAMVIDGSPFCAHCKSPQIRVPGPDTEVVVTDTTMPSGEHELGPALGSLRPPALPPHGVQWHQALPAAVLGGIVSVVVLRLTAEVPLLALGPAWVFGAAVAVLIYRSRTQLTSLTPGDGAKIGAASAGFGFLIITIWLVGTVLDHADEFRLELTQQISQMSARGYDSKSLEPLRTALQTNEGLGLMILFVLVVLGIIFAGASMVGGALCASWLRRR